MRIQGETTYRLRYAALIIGLLFVLDGLYSTIKTGDLHNIFFSIIGMISMSLFLRKTMIILEEEEFIVEYKFIVSWIYRERYANITKLSRYGIPPTLILVIRVGDFKKTINLGQMDNNKEIFDGFTKLSGLPMVKEYPEWSD